MSFDELENILDENAFENACFALSRDIEDLIAAGKEQGWTEVVSNTTDYDEYGMHLMWEENFFNILSKAREEAGSAADVYRRVQEYMMTKVRMAEHELEMVSVTGAWGEKSTLLRVGSMVNELALKADDYEEMVLSLFDDAEAAVELLPEGELESALEKLTDDTIGIPSIGGRRKKVSLSEFLSLLGDYFDADELSLLVQLCTDEDFLAENQGRLRDAYQLFYKLHRLFDPGETNVGGHDAEDELTSGYEVLVRLEPSDVASYQYTPGGPLRQRSLDADWYEVSLDDPRSQIREAHVLTFQKEKQALLRRIKVEYTASYEVIEDE